MHEVEVPNFGELLAPYIGAVPEQAVPNFLALLERGAAQRYRQWADLLPDFTVGLNACADSEDEIADIVDEIFPIDELLAKEIQAPLPSARATYLNVFEQFSLSEQLAIQANAELQGAAAWRGMLSDDVTAQVRSGLERCIALEEASSAYLYSIIDEVRAASDSGTGS